MPTHLTLAILTSVFVKGLEKRSKNIRLIFLRHGEAENMTSPDVKRHLSDNGKLQADQVGNFLSKTLPSIPVICSHAVRTKETLEILSGRWQPESITFTSELYGARYFDIIDLLTSSIDQSETLIIGHNPGLSEVISYFVDDYVHLSPCEMFCVEFEINEIQLISKGTASIVFHFHPSLPR